MLGTPTEKWPLCGKSPATKLRKDRNAEREDLDQEEVDERDRRVRSIVYIFDVEWEAESRHEEREVKVLCLT